MNRKISADEFRASVERQLSGLKPDPWLAQRIEASDKEDKPVKKFSAAFILVAAIICISVAALAAGLIFSPTYNAIRIASQAIEDKYGLVPELLGTFEREVTKNEDGAFVVTFSHDEEIDPAPDRIGTYTVIINGSDVSASCSNDGKDTSGGLAAEAYGPDQIRSIWFDYENTEQQLIDLGIIPGYDASADPEPEDEEIRYATPEEEEQWTRNFEKEKAAEMQQIREDIAEADSRGKITVEQAVVTAKEAVIQEFSLTKEQSDKLEFVFENTYVANEGDELSVELCFRLWQNGGNNYSNKFFTDRDGEYWVIFNLKTGVIEDLFYNPGIPTGNG